MKSYGPMINKTHKLLVEQDEETETLLGTANTI